MPRLRPRAAALVALLSSVVIGPLGAQTPVRARSALWVGSPLDDYVRLLQLTGDVPLTSRLLRPLEQEARTLAIPDSGDRSRNPWRARYGARQSADTAYAGIERYDPIFRLTNNTAVPFGGNDGALWAGKGASVAIDLGVAARYGPLTVRLAPSLIYSQNLSFKLADRFEGYSDSSPYSDPYMGQRIDLPQRFGDEPMQRLEPGQSSIQLGGRGVRVGASTENMWWGPGMENAILMSNNAGGFPHLFLGTQKPVDIWIGKLEALYTVGWLQESAFWRGEIPDSLRHRWMKALVVVLEPRGAPGLYLGAARVYYQYVPEGGIPLRDMVGIFEAPEKKKLITTTNPLGDDARDQMIELFMRWVLPESNFEVYGSFGRNDHSFDQRDLIQEPDHATAYTLGLQKLFLQPGTGFVRLRWEVTSLANGLSIALRPAPTWYAHHIVTQGYTERGQVIGAAAGPGGRAANLGLDVYRRWGSVGAFADWRRVNDDAHFERYGPGSGEIYASARHDVFFGAGLRGTALLKYADVSLSLLKQTEYNRYTFTPGYDYDNLHLELSTQVHW
jgi:hypothetical protein